MTEYMVKFCKDYIHSYRIFKQIVNEEMNHTNYIDPIKRFHLDICTFQSY